MIICPECLSERHHQVGYPDEDTITYVCHECGEVFDVDDYDPGHEDDYADPEPFEYADEYGGNPEMEILAYEDEARESGNPDLPNVSGNRP